MTEEICKKVASRIEAEWYPYHENEWFTHTDICNYFQWKEPETRKAVSKKIYHDSVELDQPKLEKNNKAFRLIDRSIDEISWDEANPDDVYHLYWPCDPINDQGFDFENYINLPPKSLVVIAGTSNAGKTTMLLNIMIRNLNQFETHYFTSELSAVALKRRLKPFEETYNFRDADGKPRFKIWDRTDNFHDAVKPDGLNIIDYLDVNNDAEYFKLKPYLKRIKRALNRGIAVVALQKRPGCKDAYGGANLRGDADVYIALDFNQLEIVKAKDWQKENPNNTKYAFDITNNGSMFTNIRRIYDGDVPFGE